MNILPDWAIDEIKARISDGTRWITIRSDLSKRLGWKPSSDMMYDVVHEVDTESKKTACGKEKRFINFRRGYVFCDNFSNCPCSVEEAKIARAETNLERHGAENFFLTPDFQDKSKATCLERYGSEFYFTSDEYSEKISTISMERYGTTSIGAAEEIKEKIKSTILERYGVEYPLLSPEIRDKCTETMKFRYGVEHALQVKDFHNKAKETLQNNYEVVAAMHSPELRERMRLNNIDRYGVEYVKQAHINPVDLNILQNSDLLQEAMKTNSFQSLAERMGIDSTTIRKYWAKHGLPTILSCYENEISTILDSLDIDYIMNKKHPKAGVSLDFFLPDYQLAIEFNGIYWHSTLCRKDHLYHRIKYEACRDAGIRLLMINEDEWLQHKDAIMGWICNLTGRAVKGEPARKMIVQEITPSIANDFISRYHIQGATGSISKAVGGFVGNTLVTAMAFNRQRGTGVSELIRFCSDGRSHQGAFSRLFKHSVVNYDQVISFADLRYSNGDVYHKNGFTLVDETRPDYRYVRGNKTFHKSSFTKKRIAEKFGLDMTHLTERQAMEQLGIPRIYDCGKLKFLWTSCQTPK